ncbi:hypothetical protein [Bacillus sp. Brlt_9]|uniref:hypothetical protein n=1 Tax=Bacillus sp. Brlt_9 TaxID=3110916 RepID=UPI003F7C0CCF
MLEFIEDLGIKVLTDGQRRRMVLARCSFCGNVKEFRKDHSKTYKSCGCLRLKKSVENLNKKTHGMSKDRMYKRWNSIKQRCFNPKHPNYHHYGGRGIVMCETWKEDFEKFYNWSLENGFEEDLTLDRIDNNGIYEPNNCRWVTMEEQSNNKRDNIIVEYEGAEMTLKQAANNMAVNYKALEARYRRGYRGKELFQELKEHTAGSLNGNSKLKEEQVKQIKTLLRKGLSQTKIAKMYGVSKHCIHHIKIEKTWKHVTIDDTEVNE